MTRELSLVAIFSEYRALALSGRLIASALIGAIYISPLTMLSVKQVRKAAVDYRMLALIIVVSSLAVVISKIMTNPIMLTITTQILVLFTVGVSSLITVNIIAQFLG